MPTYTLEHKETGDQHDVLMSWNDFEEHKKLHPQLKQVITQVNIGDPVNLGLRKVPTEFKEKVLDKIRANAPGASKMTSSFE